MSHSDYAASIVRAVTNYALGKIMEEAVLPNRGTVPGFAGGTGRQQTLAGIADDLVEIRSEYKFKALPLHQRVRYTVLVVVQ